MNPVHSPYSHTCYSNFQLNNQINNHNQFNSSTVWQKTDEMFRLTQEPTNERPQEPMFIASFVTPLRENTSSNRSKKPLFLKFKEFVPEPSSFKEIKTSQSVATKNQAVRLSTLSKSTPQSLPSNADLTAEKPSLLSTSHVLFNPFKATVRPKTTADKIYDLKNRVESQEGSFNRDYLYQIRVELEGYLQACRDNPLQILSELQEKYLFFSSFFEKNAGQENAKLSIRLNEAIEGAWSVGSYLGSCLIYGLLHFCATQPNPHAFIFNEVSKPDSVLKHLFAFWIKHSSQREGEFNLLHYLYYQKQISSAVKSAEEIFTTLFPPIQELMSKENWELEEYINLLAFIKAGIEMTQSQVNPCFVLPHIERTFIQYQLYAAKDKEGQLWTTIHTQLVNMKMLVCNWAKEVYDTPHLFFTSYSPRFASKSARYLMPFQITQEQILSLFRGERVESLSIANLITFHYSEIILQLPLLITRRADQSLSQCNNNLVHLLVASLLCYLRAQQGDLTTQELRVKLKNYQAELNRIYSPLIAEKIQALLNTLINS